MKIPLAFLLSLTICLQAGARQPVKGDTDIRSLAEQAMILQRSGDNAQAETLLSQAVELSRAAKGNNLLLTGNLERLADCYFLQGKFSAAEPLYLESIAARRLNNVAKDSGLCRDLTNLTVLYQRTGNLSSSDSFSKELLTFVDKNWGEGQELAQALSLRAQILTEGQAALAIPLLQRSLELWKKTSSDGSSNSKISATLNSLANAFLECDNYAAAEKTLKEALEIDQKGSLLTVIDLSGMGQLYLRQGKYSLAEGAYKEALNTITALKGEQHPETATCMNNLAFLYRNMCQFEEAEKLLRAALAIRIAAFGPEHPVVAQNLVNLADVLVASDHESDAVPLLEQALRIDEKQGDDHQDVALILRELVSILKDDPANHIKAEAYSRRLLARDEKAFGENLLIARDLETLGKILIAEDKIGDAKAIIARARSIEKMQKGVVFEADAPHQAVMDSKIIQDKWALVVGISSFKDPSLNLRFAAKDAVDFRNFLVNQANFKADHVKLLTDQEATRGNIVALLGDQWMKRVVKPDDLAVVYISSHGTQAASQVGGANFIVPYEGNGSNIVFSGIPMQWLVAGLKDLVHSDRICVFLDVCHSGAAAVETVAANGSDKNESGAKGLYRIRNIDSSLICPPGQVVVAASHADQISWESKRYSNSVFTRRLIEGLALNGQSTSLDQAFAYLREQVEEEVLRDRTQLQAPLVVPKLGVNNEPQLGCKPSSPRVAN